VAASYSGSPDQWAEAREEIRSILIELARSGDEFISYAELVKQVRSVQIQPDSQALALLLDEVSESEDLAGRGMLSALVVPKTGDQMPGPGFFNLVERLGKRMSKDGTLLDDKAVLSKELREIWSSWNQQQDHL
jgi:hypothetical protein